MCDAAVPHIDVVDGLADKFAITSIGVDIPSGRHGDLNEGELTYEVRILLKESIDGPESLEEAFGIVEPVHTEPDAGVGLEHVQLAQHLHGPCHRRGLSPFGPGPEADADRPGHEPGGMAFIFHMMIVGQDVRTQKLLRALDEGMEKVVGLEHGQIACQQ